MQKTICIVMKIMKILNQSDFQALIIYIDT
jgi:hypothetical protein